jgi:prophage maintenance system killer protein
MVDLTLDEIIAIHAHLIAGKGGDSRVLSEAGLHQTVFQVNLPGDIFHKAAFVFFSFCAYPPFREGNVQTALCIVRKIFLSEGYSVDLRDEDIADLVKGVESFSLEIEDLEDWLRTHAQKTAGR